MAHLVIFRVDEEALHSPDLPIDLMDTVTRPELHLTLRNDIFKDRLPVYRLGAYVDERARADTCVSFAAGAVYHAAEEVSASAEKAQAHIGARQPARRIGSIRGS